MIEKVELTSIDQKLKTGLELLREECREDCKKRVEQQGENTRRIFAEKIEEKSRELSVSITETDTRIKFVESELARTTDSTKRNLESIDTLNQGHRESVAAIANINDRLDRLGTNLDVVKTRLDGDVNSQIKVPSLEVVRQNVERHTAQLDGTQGGVPLVTIVEKFREVSTLISFGKALGLGTVATLLATVFNLQSAKVPSPEDVKMTERVSQQAKEIAELKSEVSSLVKQVYSNKPK